jgi:hypothetical protein
MSHARVVAFLLSVVAMHAAGAKDRPLSPSDMAKIKRICRQAIGYPVAREYNLWSQLTPFLRSKSELDHLMVTCSSQHCSGAVRLRDDSEILFTSVHVPPEHGKIGAGDLAPDIDYKGNNRFVGTAFLRHGKVVFRRGDLPEWFIDQHKH